MKMSNKPTSEPLEDRWRKSTQECPTCKKGLWTAGWWDDSHDSGGSCIGTIYACGSCGYRDYQ